MKRLNIRIGIDCRELERGTQTGIGRYLINFINFANSQKGTHRLILYGNQKTSFAGIISDVDYRIVPEKNTIWWDQITLANLLYKDKIDIFFSPYYKCPLFSPCPVVITIHDLFFLRYMGKNRLFYDNLIRFMGRLYAFKARSIITISEYSKKEIIRSFRINPGKISVIYNGVSNEYQQVKDVSIITKTRSKYGIRDNYILYVGNFKPHKNVEAIIKAYNNLSEDMKSQFQLVLAGKKGDTIGQLQERISRLSLENRVIFTGFINEEDMPALYSGASLFVMPSIYEGFGFPALEAMACGVPVTVSDRASLPEVVADAGVIINPEDIDALTEAMLKILGNTALREDMMLRGLNRAKLFTLDKTSSRILQILEEIAGERKKR